MKKITVATIIMGACISLIGCESSTTPNNTQQSVINEEQKQPLTNENVAEITVEEAKEIAIKHENLKSDQVIFERAELDFDNGIKKYDVEFYHENKEYDYEISASDGKIMNYDYDAEYNNQQQLANDSTAKVSIEEAKEIALKHANLKNDQVTFIRSEIDYDDGMQTYDIEFYLNNIEYNYEIDANTGHVLAYEQE